MKSALFVAAAIGALAAWWVAARGYTLYYGDAEAHLNIARRILDSRTPGPEQIGTVWLPLPHVAVLPLVMHDEWWRHGAAGAAVGVAAFALAGWLLFLAARRSLQSEAAGWTALLLFALNPNLLYLQATPMTEPLVFASLAGVLWSTLVWAETQAWWSVVLAAAFANAGVLSRYEGWFVLPFAGLYIWLTGRKRRWSGAAVFAALAALGPIAWLAHNLYYYGDPLEFYHGQWSAKMIYQRFIDAGGARYPGDHEWAKAWLYFRSAAWLNAGAVLTIAGLAGLAVALLKRAWWPVLFLSLPPAFYVLSMYSSGTPIFLPHLWPNSYYNARYGLAALPLLAFGGAALAAVLPQRLRVPGAAIIVLAALAPWFAPPSLDRVVCWKEAEVNHAARRSWTRQVAAFLRANYRPGDGVMAGFGDLTGIFREAGIPLREVLHDGNGPAWFGATARPDLLMFERWAVAIQADSVSTAMIRSRKHTERFALVKSITVPHAPVIEIYRRNENPLHQGPWSKE